MSRQRMAGGADYQGRLNAAGSYLLDQLKGTGNKYQNYREIDEVFPEEVNIENAEQVLLGLAPTTKINIDRSGNITGGDAITDNKGRVNLDKIPYSLDEVSHTAPDAVNTDVDPLMGALLNPDNIDTAGDPALQRAVAIGTAMRANDPAAYRAAGMPVEVDDEAAAFIAGRLAKGKNDTPLRSTGFVKAGGVGSESRGQILIPGTDMTFNDAPKDVQKAYLDQRNNALVKQWLMQGGGSIGNPRATIVPPGKDSHMDHIRSLSSSVDTKGMGEGWGYSDDPTNFSYLDAESNVHSKLNYDIQGQHLMMKLADDMRREGQPFPARLSQSELGDPNRRRLTDEEGAIRLATDKATDVNAAGERLVDIIQYLSKYGANA